MLVCVLFHALLYLGRKEEDLEFLLEGKVFYFGLQHPMMKANPGVLLKVSLDKEF